MLCAVALPSPKPAAFDDVAGSTHRRNIERLAAAGIALGSGGSYEPSATVTRAQLAAFRVRIAGFAERRPLTASRTDHFGDVPAGSTHERAIATGFEAGLLQGTLAPTAAVPCGGRCSPDAVVVRDQMARSGGGGRTPAKRIEPRRTSGSVSGVWARSLADPRQDDGSR